MLRPAAEAESSSQPAAKAPRLEAFPTSSSAGGVNPFSGLSLFSGAADGKSLFQSAAANISGSFLSSPTTTPASSGGSLGFGALAANASSSPTSTGFGLGFAGSSAPAATFQTTTTTTTTENATTSAAAAAAASSSDAAAAATSGAKANPFAGLSLFSSAGKPAEPSGAPLFTAAAQTFTKPEAATEAAPRSTSTFEEAKVIEQSETGEEDEEILFRSECRLWRLIKEGGEASSTGQGQGWRWQERGSGIVHINQHRENRAGRLVMRMRGVLKSLLNSPIIPNSKYEKVGNKSIRFTGVDVDADPNQNVQGKPPLCDFRLTLQSGDQRMHMLRILTSTFKVGIREQAAGAESGKNSSDLPSTTNPAAGAGASAPPAPAASAASAAPAAPAGVSSRGTGSAAEE